MKRVALFILFFGLSVLGGGIYGFIKAQSKPSLIMGIIFGVANMLSSIGIFKGNKKALIVSSALCAALTGFFTFRLVRNPVLFPAGIMSILSFTAALLTGATLFCKKDSLIDKSQ